MARIRSIKPGFWVDEKLTQLSPLVRLTFLGLISAMADDAGRCKGDVRLVKASVWPLDDDIDTVDIRSHLEQLAAVGRILIYQHDRADYIQIVNWKKHQRIDKPRASEHPAPPTEQGTLSIVSTTPPRLVHDVSALDTDTEGDKEGKRNGTGEDAAPSAAPPASLIAALQLPKGCIEFLAMFYEPALRETERERYRNIVQQMYDALDPNHKGPKIRGGVRVKARSRDHLERCCREVMNDPPMDRDMAIVFVLKRLLNPEPGPTVTERHKVAEGQRIQEEEAYAAAARTAGLEWARTHPDEYEPIRQLVDGEFATAGDSSFARMAKKSALAGKCATAAGFPSFDDWRAARIPPPDPPREAIDHKALAAGDR